MDLNKFSHVLQNDVGGIRNTRLQAFPYVIFRSNNSARIDRVRGGGLVGEVSFIERQNMQCTNSYALGNFFPGDRFSRATEPRSENSETKRRNKRDSSSNASSDRG